MLIFPSVASLRMLLAWEGKEEEHIETEYSVMRGEGEGVLTGSVRVRSSCLSCEVATLLSPS